jgi:hypothetical protein
MFKLKKSDYNKALILIKEFEELYIKQPPSGISFFTVMWNWNMIKKYYFLRKHLQVLKSNKSIYVTFKKLPINAWILKKYVFESLFFSLVLILFVGYLIVIPPFKGMISFFVPIIIFIYYLLRIWLIDFEWNIIKKISDIKEIINSK